MLHYAKSLDGPWTSAGPSKDPDTACRLFACRSVPPSLPRSFFSGVELGSPNRGTACLPASHCLPPEVAFNYSNPAGVPRPPNSGTSNPAPYIFPNGTVLLLGRGKDAIRNSTGIFKMHNIFLYRAASWNATYEWVPSDGVGGALNVGAGNDGPTTEDPVLYRGRRGFHIIFHSSPDLTHAWSEDGLRWHWSETVSGPPNHLAVGGGDNERPRVVLDTNGDLEWLFVGQLGVDTAHTDGARTAAFKAL